MKNSPAFLKLLHFLNGKMRLQHTYQPDMILCLLAQGGSADASTIAKAIQAEDESQLEYYLGATKNMVGKVLARHGIVAPEGEGFQLSGFGDLSGEERAELARLCREKRAAFVKEMEASNFGYGRRLRGAGGPPGSLRYQALKKAHGRCQLCGATRAVRHLEADHIVPRSKGGRDTADNLQVLCNVCNSQKSNRDRGDFRAGETWESFYGHREKGCLFCKPKAAEIRRENDLAFVVQDKYAVTPLHSLVIPKRHFVAFEDITQPENNAVMALLKEWQKEVRKKRPEVEGFNVGVNSGAAAGQTIPHLHFHLIPRAKGDVEDPRGGVRGVIPGKAIY